MVTRKPEAPGFKQASPTPVGAAEKLLTLQAAARVLLVNRSHLSDIVAGGVDGTSVVVRRGMGMWSVYLTP